MVMGANNTRDFDQFVKGMFKSLMDVLEWQPEIEQENRDDSEV